MNETYALITNIFNYFQIDFVFFVCSPDNIFATLYECNYSQTLQYVCGCEKMRISK